MPTPKERCEEFVSRLARGGVLSRDEFEFLKAFNRINQPEELGPEYEDVPGIAALIAQSRASEAATAPRTLKLDIDIEGLGSAGDEVPIQRVLDWSEAKGYAMGKEAKSREAHESGAAEYARLADLEFQRAKAEAKARSDVVRTAIPHPAFDETANLHRRIVELERQLDTARRLCRGETPLDEAQSRELQAEAEAKAKSFIRLEVDIPNLGKAGDYIRLDAVWGWETAHGTTLSEATERYRKRGETSRYTELIRKAERAGHIAPGSQPQYSFPHATAERDQLRRERDEQRGRTDAMFELKEAAERERDEANANCAGLLQNIRALGALERSRKHSDKHLAQRDTAREPLAQAEETSRVLQGDLYGARKFTEALQDAKRQLEQELIEADTHADSVVQSLLKIRDVVDRLRPHVPAEVGAVVQEAISAHNKRLGELDVGPRTPETRIKEIERGLANNDAHAHALAKSLGTILERLGAVEERLDLHPEEPPIPLPPDWEWGIIGRLEGGAVRTLYACDNEGHKVEVWRDIDGLWLETAHASIEAVAAVLSRLRVELEQTDAISRETCAAVLSRQKDL